jgi:radical SAM protein with 4Fe4S-binding SPASM domain
MNNLDMVAIEIVEGCNLYCSFCARNASNTEIAIISIKKFELFLDQLDKFEIKPSIAFTGGEPMLHKKLLKLIQITSQREFKFCIVTNGTIIDKQIISECSSNPFFRHFIISLDSKNENVHNYIRGSKTAYKKTINFMEELKEHSIAFCINMTVDKKNINDVDETIQFSKTIGAKNISVATVKPTGRGEALLSQEDLNHIAKQIIKNQKLIDNTFELFATEITFFLYDIENYVEAIENDEKWSCSFANNTLHIKFDGTIQGCATCDYVIGNIFNEQNFNLPEFWEKNETLNYVRNKRNLKGFCKTCKYVDFCGGCTCRAYTLTGDLMGDDFYCPLVNGSKIDVPNA